VYFSEMLNKQKESSLPLPVFWIIMILLILPVESEAQVTLDPGTTAVRFVFSREIERKHHAWMEETVFDEWFDGEVPKICHICDNVYRYPVDNGSMITRGLRNMINRQKLAEILEVREFLTVLVRRVAGEFQAEYFRYDLIKEPPVSTRVVKLSEPWF